MFRISYCGSTIPSTCRRFHDTSLMFLGNHPRACRRPAACTRSVRQSIDGPPPWEQTAARVGERAIPLASGSKTVVDLGNRTGGLFLEEFPAVFPSRFSFVRSAFTRQPSGGVQVFFCDELRFSQPQFMQDQFAEFRRRCLHLSDQDRPGLRVDAPFRFRNDQRQHGGSVCLHMFLSSGLSLPEYLHAQQGRFRLQVT